jgi:tRNA pseudouridine55 synthase
MGWTSHDVVQKIRNSTGVFKVGHAGTLDPLATGVLLICCGKATKITSYLSELEKEYVAVVRFGMVTDTDDAYGNILERKDVKVSREKVQAILPYFVGDIYQKPPMYSAVKLGGKRLYQIARNGQVVERKSRLIHISSIDILGMEKNDLNIRVTCSKGTYLRSLAFDLGEQLGCGAHIAALQRERVGEFHVQESIQIGMFRKSESRDLLTRHLISMNDALQHMPMVRIDTLGRKRIEHGTQISWKHVIEPDEWHCHQKKVRIISEDQRLIGLGMIDESLVRPQQILV